MKLTIVNKFFVPKPIDPDIEKIKKDIEELEKKLKDKKVVVQP